MSDINKMVSDVATLKKKIEKDLSSFMSMYAKMVGELDSRLKDELRESGSGDGLEDFYALTNIAKRNLMYARNVAAGFNKIKNIDKFEITEIEERETIKEMIKG